MKSLTLMSLTQLTTTVLGFLGALIWTRFVDPTIYGGFLLFVSLLSIASAVSLKGLDYAAQISSSRAHHKNFEDIIKKRIISSILGSLVLLGFAFYYLLQEQDFIFYALIFGSILFPIYNLKSVLESWLNGEGSFGWLSFFLVAPQILFTMFLLGFVYLNKNLSFLPYIFVFISFGLNLIFLKIISSSRSNLLSDGSSISYGIKVSAAFLIPITVASLDKVIVSSAVSLEAVAIFSVAVMASDQIKALFSIFSRLFMPAVSAAPSVKSAWEVIKFKFWILSGLFLFIGLFCVLFIENLVVFVFGIDYALSGSYAAPLCLAAAISCTPALLGNILRAQGHTKFVYSFEFFNSLVKFFALIIGGYFLGLYGMVLGLVFSIISSTLFMIVYFLWVYKSQIQN